MTPQDCPTPQRECLYLRDWTPERWTDLGALQSGVKTANEKADVALAKLDRIEAKIDNGHACRGKGGGLSKKTQVALGGVGTALLLTLWEGIKAKFGGQ